MDGCDQHYFDTAHAILRATVDQDLSGPEQALQAVALSGLDPACWDISPVRRDPAIARFILVDRVDMTNLAL